MVLVLFLPFRLFLSSYCVNYHINWRLAQIFNSFCTMDWV